MKIIDIDCIVRDMMNTTKCKPSMKIKVQLYTEGFLNIDTIVGFIIEKISENRGIYEEYRQEDTQ